MTTTKGYRALVTCVAIAIGAVIAVSLAPAAGAKTTKSATADWNGNNACAVVAPGDVRCFPTEAAMERATSLRRLQETTAAETVTSAAATYCAGRSDLWVYLYEFSGYGGRILKFRDVGYWQNLSTWGFSDQMTSWRNDTYCQVYAADGASGGGSWLTLGARSSSSYVGGTWDNRVSSIFLTG